MKVSLKNAGPCRKTMKIEVPAENVAAERAELLNYYAKGVNIHGFRKGHAPKHLVEKKFAKQLAEDLKDRVVPKYYHEAIEAEGVKVVSIFDVSEPELAEGKPLKFEVTLDVSPEFKLPKYHHIAIKAEKVDVPETEIEETLQNILRQHADYNDITGRAAQADDMVQVSYEAVVDGTPLEEKVPEARGMGNGNGYWITCDDQSFLPGMGQALTGSSIGDKKDVTVEFPEDFIVKELAGFKAEYSVEVSAMRERSMPDLADEELLKKLHVKDEAELRANIRESLEGNAKQREETRRQDVVLKYLLKKTKLDVPESAVQQQARNIVYDIARQRMMQGMTQDQLKEQSEDLFKEAKEKAVDQVRLRYIIFEIADAEGLAVDEQAVEDEVTRMAVQQQRDAADYRKELEKEGQLDAVGDQLRFRKTVAFLLENAKIK